MDGKPNTLFLDNKQALYINTTQTIIQTRNQHPTYQKKLFNRLPNTILHYPLKSKHYLYQI